MGELILLNNGQEAYLKPVDETIDTFAKSGSVANVNDVLQDKPQKSFDYIDVEDDDHVLEDSKWPSSLPQTLSMLLARTWCDPVFKTAFIANPMQVSRSLDVELPEGVSLYVDEVRGKCRVTVYEYNPTTRKHKRGMTLKLNLIAGM